MPTISSQWPRTLSLAQRLNLVTVTGGTGIPHDGCSRASAGRGIMIASATLQQMSSIRLDRWRSAVTASRIPTRRTAFTSPVVDYEPPPVGALPVSPCPPPSPAALHRHTPRPLRSVPAPAAVRPHTGELTPPRAAAVFADTALRRVLEVTDRRRPVAQLRTLLAPALFDAVVASTRTGPGGGAAVLRRVRLRTAEVHDGEATAAEVFATYSRGRRVRAIAGRVELVNGRWVVVALQIG